MIAAKYSWGGKLVNVKVILKCEIVDWKCLLESDVKKKIEYIYILYWSNTDQIYVNDKNQFIILNFSSKMLILVFSKS